LAALILEDLRHYPRSSTSEIHQRIGSEIHPRQVKRALDALVTKNEVHFEGSNRWRRYWATS
jgi:ATP-dependent DNA helicase RecG